MNNRLSVLIASVALFAVFAMFAFGQKADNNSQNATSQRYEMTTAHLEREGNVVFLLDIKEGKVWQYQAAQKTPDGKPLPESFFPIGIGLPIVGAPAYGLKKSAAEDTEGIR